MCLQLRFPDFKTTFEVPLPFPETCTFSLDKTNGFGKKPLFCLSSNNDNKLVRLQENLKQKGLWHKLQNKCLVELVGECLWKFLELFPASWNRHIPRNICDLVGWCEDFFSLNPAYWNRFTPETPVLSTVTMDQIPPPLTEHSLPPKENRRRNCACPDDSETSCRVDVVGFVILWRSLVQILDWKVGTWTRTSDFSKWISDICDDVCVLEYWCTHL